MTNPAFFTMFALASMLAGCQECPKTYTLAYVPNPGITIDGKLGEKAWSQAAMEADFHLPYETAPVPRTEFRAFCDDTNLYFAFQAWDSDVVVEEKFPNKQTVDQEDRVEIFLTPDAKSDVHYGMEIDAKGRVHDFKAPFSSYIFDHTWTCEGLRTAGTTFDKGYIVEGMIPLKTLKSLGMPPLGEGAPMLVGLFRGDYRHVKGKLESHWISWVDLRSPKHGFHHHAYFGCFRMKRPAGA